MFVARACVTFLSHNERIAVLVSQDHLEEDCTPQNTIHTVSKRVVYMYVVKVNYTGREKDVC